MSDERHTMRRDERRATRRLLMFILRCAATARDDAMAMAPRYDERLFTMAAATFADATTPFRRLIFALP